MVTDVTDLMAVMMVVAQLHDNGSAGGTGAQKGKNKSGGDKSFHGNFLNLLGFERGKGYAYATCRRAQGSVLLR